MRTTLNLVSTIFPIGAHYFTTGCGGHQVHSGVRLEFLGKLTDHG